MLRKFCSCILILFFAVGCFSQSNDSTILSHFPIGHLAADSASLSAKFPFTGFQSLLLSENKPMVNDIEQYKSSYRNATVFTMLLVLLAALTYIKTAFSKELEETLQSIINQNLSYQIFRTQSGEISFSSFVLHLNFIVAISLYVRFVFVKYYHVSSLENFSSIFFLNFLFTFFYVGKLFALKFIGNIFELKDVCNEYAFQFSIICKTLGLTLIPALFIFYTASEKFFDFIFFITLFIIATFVLLLLWRGLSTGFKLLYSNVYHFFIYVCCIEISMMFLCIKLFTKTIN